MALLRVGLAPFGLVRMLRLFKLSDGLENSLDELSFTELPLVWSSTRIHLHWVERNKSSLLCLYGGRWSFRLFMEVSLSGVTDRQCQQDMQNIAQD